MFYEEFDKHVKDCVAQIMGEKPRPAAPDKPRVNKSFATVTDGKIGEWRYDYEDALVEARATVLRNPSAQVVVVQTIAVVQSAPVVIAAL
jgi:hypothetical protein